MIFKTRDATKPRLEGVQGWLSFLTISLMYISPLLTFGRLQTDFSTAVTVSPELLHDTAFAMFKASVQISTGLLLVWGFYTGWNLRYKLVKASVKKAQIYLWGSVAISAAIPCGSALYAYGTINAEFLGILTSAIVKGLFIASIWSSYLAYSSRVANTYK